MKGLTEFLYDLNVIFVSMHHSTTLFVYIFQQKQGKKNKTKQNKIHLNARTVYIVLYNIHY